MPRTSSARSRTPDQHGNRNTPAYGLPARNPSTCHGGEGSAAASIRAVKETLARSLREAFSPTAAEHLEDELLVLPALAALQPGDVFQR